MFLQVKTSSLIKKADVIGYKEDEITIIVVKASRANYKRDVKWQEYLPYSDTFYFLIDFIASE